MSSLLAFEHAIIDVATMAVVVTFATLGAVYLAARVVAKFVRPRIAPRAGSLFALGVAPDVTAAAIAIGLVLPAFVRFEPPHEGERAGLLLFVLAVIGAWHLVALVVRAARLLIVSHAFTRQWDATAVALEEPRWGLPAFAIDAGFPVVAIAGLFRPRLYVDRRVLAACSDRELDAIAAHERAHVLHRDNLRRLMIGACEGPTSARATEWRSAAEHLADRRAADSPHRALDLAGALLTLARLAPGRSLEATMLSTVRDGGDLESRVHQLLAISATRPDTSSRRMPWIAGSSIVALGTSRVWNQLLSSVHEIVEETVRFLP